MRVSLLVQIVIREIRALSSINFFEQNKSYVKMYLFLICFLLLFLCVGDECVCLCCLCVGNHEIRNDCT